MTHTISTLGDDFHPVFHEMASSHGFRGSDKSLQVKTRFDGYGNAVVRFVVTNHGESVEYEKYDSAVGAYNLLP